MWATRTMTAKAFEFKVNRAKRVDVFLFVPIPSEPGRYFKVPTNVRDHECPTCLAQKLEPCRTGKGLERHQARPHPERSRTGGGRRVGSKNRKRLG